MKRLILLFLFCIVIYGCRYDKGRRAVNGVHYDTGDKVDTTSYPLFIDDGNKIVYQVGYMTPDKGLKLYLDTISHPAGGLAMDETVRSRLSGE